MDNLVPQFKSASPTFDTDYSKAHIIMDDAAGRAGKPTLSTPPNP